MLIRPRRIRRPVLLVAAAIGVLVLVAPIAAGSRSPSDLDEFMARVLARRDENWRKLEQYVLDEREKARLAGPGGLALAGFERDYTWFIRDGVFVRSPVRVDGVAVGEQDRRTYEQDWVERQRRREARAQAREGSAQPIPAERSSTGSDDAAGQDAGGAGALDILRQEPQFVSAAYFLKFKFEPGRYALVGRESFEGREVLRIEYYPARLFGGDVTSASTRDGDEERIERQMNKVALVTLWVEPATHQVLQYTFDNVGFDFLPARSVVRLDDVRASMRMVQAFPDVWLPGHIDARVALTLANGTFTALYDIDYRNYRQADVKARIR